MGDHFSMLSLLHFVVSNTEKGDVNEERTGAGLYGKLQEAEIVGGQTGKQENQDQDWGEESWSNKAGARRKRGR